MRKQAKMMKAGKADTTQLSEQLRSSPLSISWLMFDPKSIAGEVTLPDIPVRARLV